MNIHHVQRISLPRMAAAVALGALFAVSAFPVSAAEELHTGIAADEVKFSPGPPTLPAGVQIAVLMGNPAEKGTFAIRLKMPAGYKIPPHQHSQDEDVTVMAGGLKLATGETFDGNAAPALPPGSFVHIPFGTPHFAWVDEETVVQINGTGPFDIKYVDPKHDPRIN